MDTSKMFAQDFILRFPKTFSSGGGLSNMSFNVSTVLITCGVYQDMGGVTQLAPRPEKTTFNKVNALNTTFWATTCRHF